MKRTKVPGRTGDTKNRTHVPNRRTELNLLQRSDRAWSTSAEIPADFCDALAVIIARKGLLPNDLRKISGESAYAWSLRLKCPSPKSFDKVVELEKVLDIPKGVLTSRMRTAAAPLLADELIELRALPSNRDHVSTHEFAALLLCKPESIWTLYRAAGEYHGVRPIRVGRRLLWPVDQIRAALNQ